MDMFVRQETDTAHPRPLVPIYFIHSIEAPFCNLPGCWCKEQQAVVNAVLANATRGTLQLKEVSTNGADVSISPD